MPVESLGIQDAGTRIILSYNGRVGPMSEKWRHKTYYKPRVLISTERVLDPQFEDGLICLTGAELEMLRNLTQYLHRRSTFAEDENQARYLTPDADDWDVIQALVANLEEKLMGCDELMALFEAMLVQLQCICDKAELPPPDGGSVQPIVDDGLDDGTLIDNDPYGPNTEIVARRCAVAQLTYWQAYELLTETIQPLQENSMDIVVPAVLLLITGWIGAGPLAIPAGALLVLVGLLLDIWVDGSLADVQNAVLAHREELICALYNGLAYDYTAAKSRAADVINDIEELSPLDLVVIRALFAPWAIKLASLAYTAGTDWALANVVAGACDDCTWVYEHIYIFPPSPGTWTGGFPTYIGRYPGINIDEDAYSVPFVLPSIAENIDLEVQTIYMSSHGWGNTVGAVVLDYQDAADDWHALAQSTLTTLVLQGFFTDKTEVLSDFNVPRNDLRIHIKGQAGQTETDPWPVMPRYIRIKIYPHV